MLNDPTNKFNQVALQSVIRCQIIKKRRETQNEKSFLNKVLASEENFFITNRPVEDSLIKKLYDINTKKLSDSEPNDARYGNGNYSNFLLFDDETPIVQKVSQDLTSLLEEAVGSQIFIVDSFFNILKAGGGLVPHTHLHKADKGFGMSFKKYSVSYYLSVGDQKCEKPGILKFQNPDYNVLPSNGMVVIFPSSRLHSAAYSGLDDRLMIGVNFYSL